MSSVKFVDYYTMLSVVPSDNPEVIKTQYRRIAKHYHPDKHLDPVIKVLAQERIAELNTAYKVLSREDTRAIYNYEGEDVLTRRWEIDVTYESSEKVLEEFERRKLIDKLKRRVESLKQVGVFQTKLDATNVIQSVFLNKSLWTSPFSSFPIPQIASVGLAQGSNIDISSNTNLSFSADISNGKPNDFSPFANVKDDFPSIRSLKKWTSKKNPSNINVYIEGSHAFKKYKQYTARVGTNLTTGDASLGLTKSFLDKKTKASISYSRGTVNGLIFSLHRSAEGKSPINIEIKIAQELYTSSFLRKRVPDLGLVVSKELELDRRTTFNASAKLNGTGDSGLSVGFFHKLSKLNDVGMSVNISSELGIVVSADFKRGDFQIKLPILFSPEISSIGLAAAFFFSSIVMVSTKYLIFEPLKAKKQAKKLKLLRLLNREAVLKARKRSQEEIRALMSTVMIKREQEGNNGLVILEGFYGKLVDEKTRKLKSLEDLKAGLEEGIIVDVSIPMQYYVENSRLRLDKHSKAALFGFYDPAIKEEKELYVKYKFMTKLHEVLISDNQKLRLPLRTHALPGQEKLDTQLFYDD